MAAALAAFACVPAALVAQSSCAAAATDASQPAWPSPLDRRVVFAAHGVSLREGLDRIAASAHIRLSYSGDLLPLDRAVCLPDGPMAAGDAFTALLRGTAVAPVVAGADQVVLAPVRRAGEEADTGAAVSPRVSVLDRVVVTGSAVGATERGLTVALDVIEGRKLEQRGASDLSRALDQSLPGIWLWEQSPSALVARYGSIRGASSFGLSYPKIYVDGIEVANPLLVTQLTPEAVDHVEVIRGPQGAALYGADAISGVVNVVSRHEGADGAVARALLRSDAGVSLSEFANRPVLVQDHSLFVRGGSNLRSADLALTFGSMGEFMPAASSHEVRSTLGMRLIGSRSTLTGTARFYDKEAGIPANPLLDSGSVARSDTAPQTVRQYTLGGTATFAPSGRWTHSLTAGVDGYRLTNVPNDDAPIPSAVDSALRAARGGADRATLRLSSVARLEGANTAATLTFAAEQSTLRETLLAGDPVMGVHAEVEPRGERQMGMGGSGMASQSALVHTELWRHSSGVRTQVDASWHDALYLTSGVRLERDDALAGGSTLSTLPMVGAAAVRELGPVTAKLRAAYGRAIRPPETSPREIEWLGMRRSAGAPPLGPEEQAGVEGGMDLLVGRSLGVHVTRFDQRAFGLIQPVSILADTTAGAPMPRRLTYQLQNVGEISNRGWELQATAGAGRLSASAALALVDSRVTKLADRYTGDLRPGDRMLGVPARTASLTARWVGSRWYATWTATRVSDWTNYDRLQIARAWNALQGAPSDADDYFVGPQLRAFWMHYPAVTRLGATFSRDLPFGFALLLSGQNLLNQQRGEPDNLTIVPGRTFTFGLRTAF